MNEPSETNLQPASEQKTGINLTGKSLSYLKSIKSWTFFFSILGFIGMGMMFLVCIVLIGVYSIVPGKAIVFYVVVIALYCALIVVYFFPVLYLYRFSTKTELALKHRNEDILEAAVLNLKRHFKVAGIITIVFLVLYPIFVILLLTLGPGNPMLPNTI